MQLLLQMSLCAYTAMPVKKKKLLFSCEIQLKVNVKQI